MKHRERHPVPVPDCFGCKALTVGVAAAATPNRKPDVVEIDARQARWDRDGAAYRELRRQGYQPRGIDGCDRLSATATSAAEVESVPAVGG